MYKHPCWTGSKLDVAYWIDGVLKIFSLAKFLVHICYTKCGSARYIVHEMRWLRKRERERERERERDDCDVTTVVTSPPEVMHMCTLEESKNVFLFYFHCSCPKNEDVASNSWNGERYHLATTGASRNQVWVIISHSRLTSTLEDSCLRLSLRFKEVQVVSIKEFGVTSKSSSHVKEAWNVSKKPKLKKPKLSPGGLVVKVGNTVAAFFPPTFPRGNMTFFGILLVSCWEWRHFTNFRV